MPWSAGVRHRGGIQPGRVVRGRTERSTIVRRRVAQEAQVSAELQSMLSFNPRKIIHKILNRHLKAVRVGDCQTGIVRRAIIVEPAEKNDIRGMVSDLSKALPRVAPTEVVHER